MAKYPLSIVDSEHDGKMAAAFAKLMELHVPQSSKILDPTAGGRLLWANIVSDEPSIFAPYYDITFSDIKELPNTEQQNLSRVRVDRPQWFDAFDAVVYDPPYFIGASDTDDPREENYGTYDYSPSDLEEYMRLTHTVIPDLLKPRGKLILKCSDQFVVAERKFYLHHFEWLRYMQMAFEIVDVMIYRYHRMSPTAFQVKNRPCSVIVHSYFFVGILKDWE